MFSFTSSLIRSLCSLLFHRALSLCALSLCALSLCALSLCSLNIEISAARVSSRRLAVLELQGEVGSIMQRQAWTDAIRAASLRHLSARDVYVIDRDQFTELISPERDLLDCVGMCAAEIAREVGAQWSLSGSITNASSGHAQLVTLKLHNASGELLGVEQHKGALKELDIKFWNALTETLLERALSPLIKGAGVTRDETRDEPQDELNARVFTRRPARQNLKDTRGSNTRSEGATSSTLRVPWITLQPPRGESLCISPLITQAQYQECVTRGACESSASWGRCVTTPQDQARCLNIQQALRYAQWSGGWIPSEETWRAWARLARSHAQEAHRLRGDSALPPLFEWVTPSLKSARAEAAWRSRTLTLSPRALRQAKPLHALQINTGRGAPRSRRSPPAFAVTDLGFRVAYPQARCPSTDH